MGINPMEHNSSIKKYQLLLTAKDKGLNSAQLAQHHLSIHVSDAYFKVCCVNTTTMKCLFLETYILAHKHSSQRVQAIKQLYQDHPLLAVGGWSAVTLCIDHQQYTLIPQAFVQENKLADYLDFVCFVGAEAIKHYTHAPLSMAVAFAIDPYLLNWVQTTYKNIELYIIHQASSLIQGMWTYLSSSKVPLSPKVFVFVSSNHLHITVIQQRKLLYYNRFGYTSSDELLYYILIVMRTLQLDTNSQEIILGGDINKSALSYKKACRYIRKLSFIGAPTYLKSKGILSKQVMRTHLDVLGAHLCHSTWGR